MSGHFFVIGFAFNLLPSRRRRRRRRRLMSPHLPLRSVVPRKMGAQMCTQGQVPSSSHISLSLTLIHAPTLGS